MMKKTEGFSLIELMIVVVIVGVLLLVALPAYQDSVMRSTRSAGRGVLQDIAAKQEQYYINNKTYADKLAKLGYGVDVADKFYVNDQIDRFNAQDGDSVYQISMVLLSTVTYSMTATALGKQLKDARCGNFTTTSEGVKSNSGAGTFNECW